MNMHIGKGRSNCKRGNGKPGNGHAIKRTKPETSKSIATVQTEIMEILSDIRLNIDKNGKLFVTRESQKQVDVSYINHDPKNVRAVIKEDDISIIVEAKLCESTNAKGKPNGRTLNIKITINADDEFNPTEICVRCYVTNNKKDEKQKLQSMDLRKNGNGNRQSGVLEVTVANAENNCTYSFGCNKNR